MNIKILISLLYILFFVRTNLTQDCKSWDDRLVIPECHRSPDSGKDVDFIIKRLIGISEFYEATTDDGYILGVFRMPRENPKGVVLLQHPVSVDSKIWLVQENASTALLFWKAGYDVWLPNNRGTTYSRKHVNPKISKATYWNHSFHEMGLYDHPAVIKLIKEKTQFPQIIFIGHSMGVTSGLIYASLRAKEAARDVKVFVGFSPPAYFRHLPLYSRVSQYIFFTGMKAFLEQLNIYSILRHDAWLMVLFKFFYAHAVPLKKFMALFLVVFYRSQIHLWDPKIFNTIMTQFGSEFSLKIAEHFMQFYLNGQFSHFDYGQSNNLDLYKSATPPLYPLRSIEAPQYFIYGGSDAVVMKKDVEYLYEQLPPLAKKYKKLKIQQLDHKNLYYTVNRNNLLFEPLIKFLDSI